MKSLKSVFRKGSTKTQDAPSPPPPAPITQAILARSERISPASSSQIYKIDGRQVVKTGDGVRMAEAVALRFVRERTSVPVPEVYDAYISEETSHVCIVMEYIAGRPLDEAWDAFTDAQKRDVVAQLKQHTDELRSVPGTFIGSVDGTYCEDQFFSNDMSSSGPFESESAFHDGSPVSQIVLTHNDLAPRNILVRDAKVVAIVDWEFSGFYPEYWEYVKAMCWPDWQSSWIKEGVVDKILQPFVLELAYNIHVRDIVW